MNAVKTIQLGKRVIGDGQPCFIVAEAGVNHNGSIEQAKKLVEVQVVTSSSNNIFTYFFCNQGLHP